MKATVFTILLTICTYFSKAQVDDSKAMQPKIAEIEKPQGTIKTRVTEVYQQPTSQTKSDYNNWEVQILSLLVDDIIPKEFPLFKITMTDDEYKSIITKWATENPTFFKQPK